VRVNELAQTRQVTVLLEVFISEKIGIQFAFNPTTATIAEALAASVTLEP